MKQFIKTLLLVTCFAQAAEASTELLTEVVNNTGSSTYATGSVSGVVDLDGRTLIEGNNVTPSVTHALDESVNVSAVVSGCQTADDGVGTGGLCTMSGISSLDYSIVGDELHYTLSTFGGWMPSPHGPGINGVNVSVQVQLSFQDEVSGAFDPSDQSIQLTFEDTEWVDIHYSVNGSPLYNYRMMKSGDSFSHQIPFPLENGDIIEYFTTAQPIGAGAVDSAWNSFEVSGLSAGFQGHFEGTAFFASSEEELDFVDVHYSINGSILFNHAMSGDGFEYSVPVIEELNSGDQLSYFFTYAIDGIATDTAWNTITIE